MELPGGLGRSLPHLGGFLFQCFYFYIQFAFLRSLPFLYFYFCLLGRLIGNLCLCDRSEGAAQELGGGRDEDEAEVEQHAGRAHLLPGGQASCWYTGTGTCVPAKRVNILKLTFFNDYHSNQRYSPRGSRPPSNGPDYNLRSAYSRESLTTPSTDMSTFVDYKKVLGELENSRF